MVFLRTGERALGGEKTGKKSVGKEDGAV